MIKDNLVFGEPILDIPQDLMFGEYVINKLREHGDETALINAITQEQISYRQLVEKVERIGCGLRVWGVGAGDVVAICSENCWEHLAVTVAASLVGATLNLINIKYTRDEMVHALRISKPKLVFCSEAMLESKLTTLLQAPYVEYVVQLSGAVTMQGVSSLADVEASGRGMELEPVRGSPAQDTAFIFYSSGTTGLPKGVMLTHQNVIYGATIYNYSCTSKARALALMPWYHVYGLLTTAQYLVSGDLVIFTTEFVPEKFLDTIQAYQISEIPAVPPMVHILAKSPLAKNYDLSSVRHVWCAGAPVSADIIRSAQENMLNRDTIYQVYGMTETALAVLKEKDNNRTRTLGSCGAPLPGIIVKVVDVVTRERLGPHEQGEMCVKGPTLMKGYVNNEEASKAMIDDEGFIKTGDIAYYDDHCCFYIVDRLKELIKYKGQQVAPAAVESVILQHQGVAECGVVGAPHEAAGELPTAFVVPKPGVTLTAQEILDFTTPRLSPISRLRGGVIFVEEIPRNASGKILRRELRNQLKEINGSK